MNIGEMQRSLSAKAERDKRHRFDDLFNLAFHPEWLRLAHDHVARNAGSLTAGCDGIDMGAFDEDLEGNLRRLASDLKSEEFEAHPVRRVYIPKSNGRRRPLGIPTVRDRIVQEAVRMILEPIYEADFKQDSYGFRPNRRTMDAVIRLWPFTNHGYFWAIEGDISSYFDTIHHRKLMKLLRRRVADDRLLDLIWGFLRAGVMERGLFKKTERGTPQGGIISPLLANVYLHELDCHLARYTELDAGRKLRRRRKGEANFAYVRYADDFVILCNGTMEQTLAMRDEVREFLDTRLRLSLSMEKTKVTHLGEGFDFLGFHLRWKQNQHGKSSRITIAERSVERHRHILKAATSPSTVKEAFAAKTIALNRIIAGWCRYYQYTHDVARQFDRLAYEAFWLYADWLAAKHRISLKEVMLRFKVKGSLGVECLHLLPHGRIKRKAYTESPHKPNPYTTVVPIEREELLEEHPWLGWEKRPGWMDIRLVVLERDKCRCRMCGEQLTPDRAQVDHIRPYACFKRPVDANRLDNLWTLCIDCHKEKSESDR